MYYKPAIILKSQYNTLFSNFITHWTQIVEAIYIPYAVKHLGKCFNIYLYTGIYAFW